MHWHLRQAQQELLRHRHATVSIYYYDAQVQPRRGSRGVQTMGHRDTLHSRGGGKYFFCSACDLWDALPPDASKKISMDSLKFGCKANHPYFWHPTTQRKEDCYSGRQRRTPRQTSNPATRSRARLDTNTSGNESSKESFSSSSDSSTTALVLTTNRPAMTTINHLFFFMVILRMIISSLWPYKPWWSNSKVKWYCYRDGIASFQFRTERFNVK